MIKKGDKFGKLVVIEKLETKIRGLTAYKCICGCGKFTTATGTDLKSGHKKSCGCLFTYDRPNDIIGKKFGQLKVLEKTKTKKHNSYLYKCKCDCGNITYQISGRLKSGNTRSCGCIKSKLFKEQGWNKNK